MTTTDT